MSIRIHLLDERPQGNARGALLLLALLAGTVVFAGLWLRERCRAPVRVAARPVPQEIVKKVELPAALHEEQSQAMALGRKFLGASFLASEDDSLYQIRAVNVKVTLPEAVGKALHQEQLRSKLEAVLLRNHIEMDTNSPVLLSLEIDGRWDEDQSRLTYTCRLRVYDVGYLARAGEVRKGTVEVWGQGSYGFAGKGAVEEALTGCVGDLAESFSAQMLTQRSKETAVNQP